MERENSAVQFDSLDRRRFSLGIPVSSCSNTGARRGGPSFTSRENNVAS